LLAIAAFSEDTLANQNSDTSASKDALTVGIIGTGRPFKTEGSTGFGMSRSHARGYKLAGCKITALADVNPDNAKAFQADFGGDRIYTDYREMLRDGKLDIVSIATWPRLHHDMVIAAAEAGVRAIHCEKPMAPTFGESRAMVEACARHKVQLTFNHQRRFNPNFRKGRELLRDGAIGALQRIEASSGDLFDWGTHLFDIMNYFNDDHPAQWVIGQVELRGTRWVFDAPCEGQGISHFKYVNGTRGYLSTGHDQDTAGGVVRLFGSEGQISFPDHDGPMVRLWSRGKSDWEDIQTETAWAEGKPNAVALGVMDLVDALRTGREPELSGRRALAATEMIFATYESSRRGGRVDLPLTISDSPLQTMLDAAGMFQKK
jgi:UDP-N-acetylglucosamine 3-dehydrogenase